MVLAAGLLAATSCSDFDDYNEVKVDEGTSAGITLWGNILQNPQLSDFADLVRQAGFNDELDGTHFYTVWAPLNGTYDAAALRQKDNEELLYQFVKSHVAEYNHNASGQVEERIHALNAKSFSFLGSGNYTYGGIGLQQSNIASKNGTLHLLNGAAQFYPNVYENLWIAQDIDSAAQYFKKYEYVTLDLVNSVPGPTIDGIMTYIDSVMVTTNTLVSNTLRAKIENEDSSYTMLVPNNNAWNEAYNRIKPYFNYLPTTVSQDIASNTAPTTGPTKEVKIDNIKLRDSLTYYHMTRNLVYSNTSRYNQWMIDESAAKSDTLYTTTRRKLSNPDDILGSVVSKQVMSNGQFLIVDSLAMHPWETYCPSLLISHYNQAHDSWNGSDQTVNISALKSDYDEISVSNGEKNFTYYTEGRLSYLWSRPITSRGQPQVVFYLPGVLSTTYHFYCIMMPTNAAKGDTTAVDKPNNVNFALSYCTDKGALATYNFSSDLKHDNPRTPKPFNNDPTKVDVVYLGKFTFPVAYSGLGECYPNLRVTSSVSTTSERNRYTRDLRIAGFFMLSEDYYNSLPDVNN